MGYEKKNGYYVHQPIETSILKKENTSLTLYMHNLSLKVILIDDDDKKWRKEKYHFDNQARKNTIFIYLRQYTLPITYCRFSSSQNNCSGTIIYQQVLFASQSLRQSTFGDTKFTKYHEAVPYVCPPDKSYH